MTQGRRAVRIVASGIAFGFLSTLVVPTEGYAQSLLERPPNLSGNWTGASGTLYFHFVHRFTASDAPERKVSNVPTFLLAAGLPKRLLAGFNYSTNSTLAPRFPNEWELFARWAPLSTDYGAPVDLGAQLGYNNAAAGVDGELSVARKFGMARLLVAGRAMSDPLEEGNVRYALAGGATIRLSQNLALAGDVASLMNRDSSERVAWSAGVHFGIPLTPHTVSIHATNALLTTLQGASRGSSDVRYGFEFTIPLTLRRYFGRRGDQDAAADSVSAVPVDTPSQVAVAEPPRDTVRAVAPPGAPPAAVVPPAPAPARATTPRTTPRTTTSPPAPRPTAPRPAPTVVKMSIKNVNYLRPRLTVTIGTTVEWTNNDPVAHTVTANDKSFNSGLINPGRTYRRTFTKAGTYSYFCIPHPFMKGVIVVREP